MFLLNYVLKSVLVKRLMLPAKCVYHGAFQACLIVTRLNGGLIVGNGSEWCPMAAGVCVMTSTGNYALFSK